MQPACTLEESRTLVCLARSVGKIRRVARCEFALAARRQRDVARKDFFDLRCRAQIEMNVRLCPAHEMKSSMCFDERSSRHAFFWHGRAAHAPALAAAMPDEVEPLKALRFGKCAHLASGLHKKGEELAASRGMRCDRSVVAPENESLRPIRVPSGLQRHFFTSRVRVFSHISQADYARPPPRRRGRSRYPIFSPSPNVLANEVLLHPSFTTETCFLRKRGAGVDMGASEEDKHANLP